MAIFSKTKTTTPVRKVNATPRLIISLNHLLYFQKIYEQKQEKLKTLRKTKEAETVAFQAECFRFTTIRDRAINLLVKINSFQLM